MCFQKKKKNTENANFIIHMMKYGQIFFFKREPIENHLDQMPKIQYHS